MEIRELKIKQVKHAITIVNNEIFRRKIVFKKDLGKMEMKVNEMEFVKTMLINMLDMLELEKPKDKGPNPIPGQEPLLNLSENGHE